MKPPKPARVRVFLTAAAADARNILREPVYFFLIIAAPLLGGLLRIGFPLLEDFCAAEMPGLDLRAYLPTIFAFFALLPSMLAGFLTGFLFLEDRDGGIDEFYAASPLRYSGYILHRLALSALLGFLGTLVFFAVAVPVLDSTFGPALEYAADSSPVFAFSPAVRQARSQAALLPGLIALALQGPWFALLLSCLAKNKVEGLALGKVLSLVLLAPPAELLLPLPYRWAAEVVPQFQLSKSLTAGFESGPAAAVFPAAAAAGLYLFLMYPLVRKLLISH